MLSASNENRETTASESPEAGFLFFSEKFWENNKTKVSLWKKKRTIKKTFLIQSIFWKEDANFPIHVGEVADCASRPSAPDPLFSFLKPFYRKTK